MALEPPISVQKLQTALQVKGRLLWGECIMNGYAGPIWMTYKQAQELGAQVRKGEHGSLVVYADRITKTEQDENGQDVEREIPFMRSYTVFNVEQIDGLSDHYYTKPANPLPLSERIAGADAFVSCTGATIRHGGNQAFRDAQSYYATALHELTHWTKHEKRLNRDFGRKKFGDEGYAREELVAELGAAFLCADLGITPDIREDHAAYLGHWLDVLKEDKRAIFSAAAHAQRAADYLAGLVGSSSEEREALTA